jgi:hypothetical protein
MSYEEEEDTCMSCHWTFNEMHLIAAGLQGTKCSQVYLRMRRAFQD